MIFYDFMKLIEECIWYDVFEITFYIFLNAFYLPFIFINIYLFL